MFLILPSILFPVWRRSNSAPSRRRASKCSLQVLTLPHFWQNAAAAEDDDEGWTPDGGKDPAEYSGEEPDSTEGGSSPAKKTNTNGKGKRAREDDEEEASPKGKKVKGD